MSEATKEVSQSSKRSRRELLAGAAGALGALAAESLGRIPAAQATQGQPIIAGKSNDATAPTGITNSSSGAAFYVFAATGTGLVGNGGDSSGNGMQGNGGFPNGNGVLGHGFGTGDGVVGHGGGQLGRGVVGLGGAKGIGVDGTGQGTGPGVRGGGGPSGDGVLGVGGFMGAVAGVHGFSVSPTGFGVLAENGGDGTALKVAGPAEFSRSGTVNIAAPAKSAVVSGVALTASSLVLATLQNKLGGVMVASAVPNVAGSSFTVNLNKAPGTGKTAVVAWFVVN